MLAGDSKEIRDIGYLSWSDPLAHLEAMKGVRWSAVIQKENTHLKKAVRSVSEDAVKFAAELEAAKKELDIFPFRAGSAIWRPGCAVKWLDAADSTAKEGADFDTFEDYLWITEDDSGGSEIYTLKAYKKGKKEPVWKIHEVGPDVVYHGGRIYYQKIRNIQWKYSICSVDAFKGHEEVCSLETKDTTLNLFPIRTGDHLYIKTEDYKNCILYKIDPKTYKASKVAESANNIIPYGAEWIREEDSTKLLPAKYRLLWISSTGDWIMARSYAGLTSIWYKKHLVMKPTIGKVYINTKSSCSDKLEVYIVNPQGQQLIIYNRGQLEYKKVYARSNLQTKYSTTKSKDGTEVGYLTITKEGVKHPKALLVYGYGAYGLETPIGKQWSEWGPLLERGWAVIYSFIRGGGDGDWKWAKAAQTVNRVRAIDDFEAVVRSARKKLNVTAHNTVIYGRSAGGLLVGAMTSRWPKGTLFGATYTEVPYVDILRTTTNLGLPLTQLEYYEFGNPIKRIEDMSELIKISPVDTLPQEGADIFVIARTGENDSQVLAYEPVKWILRLRGVEGKNKIPKLLGFSKGEGHFFSGKLASKTRGEDLALLNSWVRHKISPEDIEMARRDRKTRQRKTRKAMEGGKRRRRATRRHRKTARKH